MKGGGGEETRGIRRRFRRACGERGEGRWGLENGWNRGDLVRIRQPDGQPASKQIQQSHFLARYAHSGLLQSAGEICIGKVANGASTGYTRRLVMTVSMMISWYQPYHTTMTLQAASQCRSKQCRPPPWSRVA